MRLPWLSIFCPKAISALVYNPKYSVRLKSEIKPNILLSNMEKNLIGNDLSAITIANLLWYFLTIVLITPFPFYGKDQKGGDHYLNEDREHDLLIPVYPSVAYRCVACQQGLYVCEETVDQDLLHQVVHSVVLKCHTFARGVADCVGRGHSSSRLAMRLASASFNANKGQTTSFGSKPKGKHP